MIQAERNFSSSEIYTNVVDRYPPQVANILKDRVNNLIMLTFDEQEKLPVFCVSNDSGSEIMVLNDKGAFMIKNTSEEGRLDVTLTSFVSALSFFDKCLGVANAEGVYVEKTPDGLEFTVDKILPGSPEEELFKANIDNNRNFMRQFSAVALTLSDWQHSEQTQ